MFWLPATAGSIGDEMRPLAIHSLKTSGGVMLDPSAERDWQLI